MVMYIDDGASEDELREMVQEMREQQQEERVWLMDPRLLMSEPEGPQMAADTLRNALVRRGHSARIALAMFAATALSAAGLGIAGLLPAWAWVPVTVAAGIMASLAAMSAVSSRLTLRDYDAHPLMAVAAELQYALQRVQ